MPMTARAVTSDDSGLEAVAGLDLLPRLGEPVHRHGEVLAVEPLRHGGVAEEHEPEQRQHLLEGGGQLAVEAVERLLLALGVSGSSRSTISGRRDELVDRLAERLDDGLEEQLVLALEVAVDHALADPARARRSPGWSCRSCRRSR